MDICLICKEESHGGSTEGGGGEQMEALAAVMMTHTKMNQTEHVS